MSTEIEGAIITPVSSMEDGNIPLDFQVQILSLLPVKSLIRFKSVCKEWSALFSNPNFINKHLNLTSQNPYHDSIVVHRFSNTGDHMTNIVFNGSIDRPITLPNPYPNWELELVGSVNGIICYCSLPVRKLVVLWNPATQYRKVIRYHKPRNLLGEMHYVRFGYDQVDNDFKIIWIERERNSSVMELYSVNKNSWIEIKVPFDLNTLNTDFNTTVKGMFCFSAFIGYRGRYREDLLGFDFHNEVLHRFPTVEHVISEPGSECLTNLNNTLGMVVYYKANRVFKYFEVDAEYSCLSEIYTVGPISSDVKVNWLLTCFKNGHIVFEGHRGNIFSLDPKTMKSKNLGVNGAGAKSKSHRYRAFCYTGSLVFVEGMEHFNKHERKEKPTG